ncbi:MAG TPA: NAD-dependent deacylase [Thermoanaerobaculia bacterium]|nr:NAD-dependent deacylase [Thermoanaerobaculia bacterium]
MSEPDLTPLLDLLPELLSGRPLAVLTGAGISAESGLPTFRGPGGLWEGNRPEDLATPEAFAHDPEKVWRFYAWRLEKLRGARPNEGHLALARMERILPRMTLVTQNVDGLHAAAGSRNLLELHGNLLFARCTECERRSGAPEGEIPPLPRCACGGLLRPDVVWFGEALAPEVWAAAARRQKRERRSGRHDGRRADDEEHGAFLGRARRGAYVFEINIEETPLAPLAAGVFRSSAAEVLPAIVRALARGIP